MNETMIVAMGGTMMFVMIPRTPVAIVNPTAAGFCLLKIMMLMTSNAIQRHNKREPDSPIMITPASISFCIFILNDSS